MTQYAIGGIALLLIIAWIAMRGDSYSTMHAATVSRAPGADGAVTYGEYGNTEGSVPFAATGGSPSVSMPSNWPPDAPANYPNASMTYAGTMNPGTGKSGSFVSYNVNVTWQTVADYYTAQLASSGWTVDTSAMMGGSMIISAKKNGRTFGISVTETGKGYTMVIAGLEL